VNNTDLVHEKSREYASSIMKAVLTDVPYRINANVINTGLIDNLPKEACVEVPCLVDRNGVTPCHVGNLPVQCAALNRTNINVQLMTIEAFRSKKKDDIYMAAYLDPHTSSELSMDDIKAMCDDLIDAHGNWLPKFN
jgi:alpha-galactosidase